MTDPYAETDEWPTPPTHARPATVGDERARVVWRDRGVRIAALEAENAELRDRLANEAYEHDGTYDEMSRRVDAAEAELRAMREAVRIGVELDNHHNAAVCPYCTKTPRLGNGNTGGGW